MLEEGLTNSEYELLEGSFKERPEDNYPHECAHCESKFEEFEGGLQVRGENEKYCPECVKNNLHIEAVRDYCETISDSPTECTKAANEIIENMFSI